jgi:hypothetical protein
MYDAYKILIVLFGLTNALTTFSNLMNDVLCRMCVVSWRSFSRIGIFMVMGRKNKEFLFLISKKKNRVVT